MLWHSFRQYGNIPFGVGRSACSITAAEGRWNILSHSCGSSHLGQNRSKRWQNETYANLLSRSSWLALNLKRQQAKSCRSVCPQQLLPPFLCFLQAVKKRYLLVRACTDVVRVGVVETSAFGLWVMTQWCSQRDHQTITSAFKTVHCLGKTENSLFTSEVHSILEQKCHSFHLG